MAAAAADPPRANHRPLHDDDHSIFAIVRVSTTHTYTHTHTHTHTHTQTHTHDATRINVKLYYKPTLLFHAHVLGMLYNMGKQDHTAGCDPDDLSRVHVGVHDKALDFFFGGGKERGSRHHVHASVWAVARTKKVARLASTRLRRRRSRTRFARVTR